MYVNFLPLIFLLALFTDYGLLEILGSICIERNTFYGVATETGGAKAHPAPIILLSSSKNWGAKGHPTPPIPKPMEST